MNNSFSNFHEKTIKDSLKKAEKICAALLIVFEGTENNYFKTRIQEICLNILSFFNNFDLEIKIKLLLPHQVSILKSYFNEIISILNVCVMSQTISEMNYQILIKEIESFLLDFRIFDFSSLKMTYLKALTNDHNQYGENDIKDELNDNLETLGDGIESLKDTLKDIKDIKDTNDIKDIKEIKEIKDMKTILKEIKGLEIKINNLKSQINKNLDDTKSLKDTLKDIKDIKDTNDIKDIKDIKEIKDNLSSKDNLDANNYDYNKQQAIGQIENQSSKKINYLSQKRRELIFSFIKERPEVSFNEIVQHLKEKGFNFGKKTIYREIKWLLSQGFIKAFGQKRWAKYSLLKKDFSF